MGPKLVLFLFYGMYLECARGLACSHDTRSLGFPSLQVVYHPSVSTLVTASRFLARDRKAELKFTPFSPYIYFPAFVWIFSSPVPSPPKAI